MTSVKNASTGALTSASYVTEGFLGFPGLSVGTADTGLIGRELPALTAAKRTGATTAAGFAGLALGDPTAVARIRIGRHGDR